MDVERRGCVGRCVGVVGGFGWGCWVVVVVDGCFVFGEGCVGLGGFG